ncbi:MAG: RidA family protein [Dehalococcoidia bacterium]|nr:RidA family protein [Dehalococcoidia bacterium]
MRTTIMTGSHLETALGTATLVATGDRLFSSGLIPSQRGSAVSEARQVYQAAADVMHRAGSSLADVVRVRAWFTDGEGIEAIRAVHPVLFDDPGPTLSVIGVPNLPNGVKVMLELEAVLGSASSLLRFLPQSGQGWSRAVRHNDEVWISGLTSADVEGSNATLDGYGPAVTGVIDAASASLTGIGVEPSDVVATRHFMARDVHGWALPRAKLDFMARSTPTSAGITVDRSSAENAPFMFECEAVAGASEGATRVWSGRTYETEHNYCRAVKNGDVVYVAGTTSTLVGEIVQHPYEVAGQVRDILEIIRWALEEHGLDWTDLVRTRTYIVGGPDKLLEAQSALQSVVGGMGTAAAVIGIPVLARPEVVVEIEATAVVTSG